MPARRRVLQRLFSTFPGGSPGFGLLILRVALGITVLFRGAVYLSEAGEPAFFSWIFGFFIVVAVLFLIAGFLTPMIGAIVFAGVIFSLASANTLNVIEIYAAILAAAVTLLGPGAFSLDARLFGRREIVIR